MNIQNLQSTNSLLTEIAPSSSSNTQSPLDSALSGLMSSIQSGNTADAEKYLAQAQKLSSSTISSDSPLGKFLSSVSTALSNNDIDRAQSALTTLETYATQAATAATSTPSTDASSSSSSTSGSALSTLGQDVLNLFSAISSGDVSDAQSAYDSLTSLLSSNDNSSTELSTTGSGDSDSSSSFQSLLSQIGSALSSNNITGAQSALDSFLQSLSIGSLVNTTA